MGYAIDDFQYNGVNVCINIQDCKSSSSNPFYRFEFVYKDCRVYDWYRHDDMEDAYSWANLYCRLIDKHGCDGVSCFKKCKEIISNIKNTYIVIGNNVYRFNHTTTRDIGPHKLHYMSIEMSDGVVLDGESSYNNNSFIQDNKDEYSSKKTFQNLQSKVSQYFYSKSVYPDQSYFLEAKTKEYTKQKSKYQDMIQ